MDSVTHSSQGVLVHLLESEVIFFFLIQFVQERFELKENILLNTRGRLQKVLRDRAWHGVVAAGFREKSKVKEQGCRCAQEQDWCF